MKIVLKSSTDPEGWAPIAKDTLGFAVTNYSKTTAWDTQEDHGLDWAEAKFRPGSNERNTITFTVSRNFTTVANAERHIHRAPSALPGNWDMRVHLTLVDSEYYWFKGCVIPQITYEGNGLQVYEHYTVLAGRCRLTPDDNA